MAVMIGRIIKLNFALLMTSLMLSSAMAVDMYVSSTGNNTVYRMKDDGSYAIFNDTIASPTGLTFGNGKFFINSGGSKIVTLTWTGVVTDFITSGISNPSGLAYGPDGFLYIADSGSNSILRSDDTGNLTTFATGLSNPRGLTFDNQGNLYVTNGITAGSISKITRDGTRTTFTTGLNSPFGIAFGSNNLLYVTTPGDGGVSEVTLAGVATLKGAGIPSPTGVYFSSGGDVRVASQSTGIIYSVFSVAQATPFASGFTSPSFISVPEPSTYVLGCTAILLLGVCKRRKPAKS